MGRDFLFLNWDFSPKFFENIPILELRHEYPNILDYWVVCPKHRGAQKCFLSQIGNVCILVCASLTWTAWWVARSADNGWKSISPPQLGANSLKPRSKANCWNLHVPIQICLPRGQGNGYLLTMRASNCMPPVCTRPKEGAENMFCLWPCRGECRVCWRVEASCYFYPILPHEMGASGKLVEGNELLRFWPCFRSLSFQVSCIILVPLDFKFY